MTNLDDWPGIIFEPPRLDAIVDTPLGLDDEEDTPVITAELTLIARTPTHWAILQETVASIAPDAQAIKSVGDGSYRIHLSRGRTAPRDWRRALATLTQLADEGEP